tara:strand:+ start:3149 stop:4708 length:1560 start_codon:yes stop_codon:yes gene_type:complete
MPKKLRKGFTNYTSPIDYLIGKIRKLKNIFFFDKHEIFFLKNFKTKKNVVKKNIVIIQMHATHYHLAHFSQIIKNERFSKCEFIGLWTNIVFYKSGKFAFLKFCYDYLNDYLLKRKWKKLYKKIGINLHYNLNNNLISNLFPSNNSFVQKNLKNLTSKKINEIKYENTKIGCHIYDTYLRYYNKAKFDQSDKSKIKYIFSYVVFSFDNLNKLYRKYKSNITYYLTSDNCYIQNGIPINFFAKKKIKVIGGSRTNSYILQYNKHSNGMNYENYFQIFKNLKDKDKKINEAKKFIYKSDSKLLSRKLDYATNNKFKKLKLDVLIFLPDFTDAPHGKGWLAFNDCAEWIEETLDFLLKKNIKIGVKPHPMSLYASIAYEIQLKNKYKNKIKWLSNETNNLNLFKQDILFGITPSGSVTYGMALSKKIVINCGRNPYMSFNYAFTAKTKNEYFKLLKLGLMRKLKISKDYKYKIFASIYIFFLDNHDIFENISRKIKLFEFWNFEKQSTILKYVTKKDKSYKS